jgi:uncharacterized protein YkwD
MRSLILFLACALVAGAPLAAVTDPEPPALRIPDLERRVHASVNQQRSRNQAPTLRFDDELALIARAHSADMAKRNFFDHVNPDGRNATERGRRAGYLCQKVYGTYITSGLAENIYQGSLYSRLRITGNERSYDWYTPEQIAAETVESWMNSPGHRRNILEQNYDREGIGIAVAGDHKIYVTQVFC